MSSLKNSERKDICEQNKNEKSENKDIFNKYIKNKKLIISLFISTFLLIIIIGIILAYFLLIKKQKNNDNEQMTLDKQNSIEAMYILREGKEMALLNPKMMDLKDEDYTIEEIEFSPENKNNLRFLKVLSISNGKYIPTASGILTSKITFNKNLNSLDGLFKDNKDLIQVNLTNLNMNNVISMNSTFSGCSNLKVIDFDGVDSPKLEKMENTFENCNELINVNLSPLNTTNLVYMKNIFSGCQKLGTINLASFNKINGNFFDGIQSTPNIIANEFISNNISDSFDKLFSVKVSIEYRPDCLIGENEKCKTCNTISKKQCGTCNEGYFLPKDNKTICQKCDLDGCLECFGKKDNKLCLKCQDGYDLINNKCIKKKCVIGKNEKCTSCRNEIGKEKVCATCNDGYYIPENSDSSVCSKCSIKNCYKCSIVSDKEICLECNVNFTENKNIFGTIEACTCPSDHKLINNLCLEYENWIEMEYNVTDYSKPSQIMNTLYTNIELNEIDLYYKDTIVSLTKDSTQWDKPIFYKFDKNGLFKLKINIKKTLTSMAWMFTNLQRIKSIKFLPGFDSSKVTRMDHMFACSLIEYIDMKYLDTRNLLTLSNFLSSAISITSLDISNFNTSKTNQMREMFRSNNKLKEIDLSSFDTSKVQNCLVMFNYLPSNIIIKISNKFTKCREQISYENKIINIDDLSCEKHENCEKCQGSKETLSCVKCKIGYQLLNGQCIRPKCNLGENEKCLLCQNILKKENECLECNEGYYLPDNSLNKKSCLKCLIDGCKKCEINSQTCEECKINYEPIIDTSTGLIINCKLQCELGEKDKCLTCENQKGKESQCASCNSGYKLINGKCKKIENSFIGIYDVTSTSTFTRIMCVSENNIKLSDFDMYVNGKKVKPYIDQGRWRSWMDENYIAYTFPTMGKNEVKIIFNKTLTNMRLLFVDCYNLISIDFHEAFDTSHVQSMYYMFSSCDLLQNINVSSFNTSLVGDMEGMFTGCDSLTSLNLSNFDTKNVDYMQCIFAYSEKLSYLDISSFDTTFLSGGGWMFDDLAEKGTVIIGKKFNRQSSLIKRRIIIKKN